MKFLLESTPFLVRSAESSSLLALLAKKSFKSTAKRCSVQIICSFPGFAKENGEKYGITGGWWGNFGGDCCILGLSCWRFARNVVILQRELKTTYEKSFIIDCFAPLGHAVVVSGEEAIEG